MQSNFEAFNQVVGLIFAQLLQAFPAAIEVDLDAIADATSVEIRPYEPPELVITPRTKTYGELIPGVDMEQFSEDTSLPRDFCNTRAMGPIDCP